MAISLGSRSRLRFKELLEINGVTFWELDELPVVPDQVDDIYYMVTQTDRIDLLSTTFYGDSNMWWVIAVANNLNLLPSELVPGTTLRIPSPNYVANVLFNKTVV